MLRGLLSGELQDILGCFFLLPLFFFFFFDILVLFGGEGKMRMTKVLE